LFKHTDRSEKGPQTRLAICKTNIAMTHGTLKVTSTPGETTFTVSIPVQMRTNSVDH